MRKHFATLTIRRMQNKTLNRYHYNPIKWLNLNKSNNTKCQQGFEAFGTLTIKIGNGKQQNHLENGLKILKILNSISFSNPTTKYLPKTNGNIYPHRSDSNVHSILVHKAPTGNNPKAYQFSEWIKKCYIYKMKYCSAFKRNCGYTHYERISK